MRGHERNLPPPRAGAGGAAGPAPGFGGARGGSLTPSGGGGPALPGAVGARPGDAEGLSGDAGAGPGDAEGLSGDAGARPVGAGATPGGDAGATPGELFAGRFRIEREAGVGGMGVVYRAIDEAGGGPVALKVLRKTDATALRRFAVEAASLERLRHPAIVRYLAHGASGEGEPFLAMQWVEGEALRERLERGPLDLGEALALGRRVADALAAAHASGILHRDLKPGNVMLAGGSAGGATLVDFGIARDATNAPVTATGDFVGTVGYLAPEQARGERDLDGRADLFSLGCVLFRCLTNIDPFEGREALTVLAKLVLHEAPRLAAHCPEVPAELDELVARLLAKDRAGRPASAEALSAELARLAEGVAAGTLRPARGAPRDAEADAGGSPAKAAPVKVAPAKAAPVKAAPAQAAPANAAPAPAAKAGAARSRRRYLLLAGLGLVGSILAGALIGLAPTGRRPTPGAAGAAGAPSASADKAKAPPPGR